MKRKLVFEGILTATIVGGHLFAPYNAYGAAPADLKKLQITIDTKGIATTVHKQILKPIPSHPLDEVILLNGEPERLCLTFDQDKLTGDNCYGERHLLVFPFQSYKSLLPRKKIACGAFKNRSAN